MITAWLTAIGITAGIILLVIGCALFAKALFFKISSDEGY